MLTPSELEKYSQEIVDLFAELEEYITEDLSKFLGDVNLTEPQIYKKEIAKKVLQSDSNIRNKIASTLSKSNKNIGPLLEKLATLSDKNELKDYAEADIDVVKWNKSKEYSNVVKVKIKELNKSIQAIAKSSGIAGTSYTEAYLKAVDLASLKVRTGYESIGKVIEQVTRQMIADGVDFLDYKNGTRMNIQDAVRRSVITETNQMTTRITELRADDYGVEYVETSYHFDSRPEHAIWQGKVIRRDKLAEITGYGRADGLGGVNCRHSFHPFWKGISKPVRKEKGEEHSYNGKIYTPYEATQRQRAIEHTIRKFERYEIAGIDSKDKITSWKKEYREFSKAMNIRPKTERFKVYKN